MAKQSQLDKVIASLNAEIKVLEMARDRLMAAGPLAKIAKRAPKAKTQPVAVGGGVFGG